MSCRRIRLGDEGAAEVVAWRPNSRGSAPVSRLRQAEASTELTQQETEARVQAAYQQGQKAAEGAANQRAEQRLEPAIAALNAVIQDLAGLRKRLRAEAEEDTVKLAVAIARRVLHRELSTDPEAILGIVIAAFQKLNARETQRLRISPADAAVIHENRVHMDLPPGLDVSADASLVPGSVIFETSRGELDASVETQLAEIERGFTDVLRRRTR
jgi:flagellar assembly protein FliH